MSYLNSHLLEVFDSQRREVLKPVFSVGELGNLLVIQAQRPHDVPLESGGSRLGHCFTLEDEKK